MSGSGCKLGLEPRDGMLAMHSTSSGRRWTGTCGVYMLFYWSRPRRVWGKARAKTLNWTPVYDPKFFPRQLSDKHPSLVPQRVIDTEKMRKVITEVSSLVVLLDNVAQGQNAARGSGNLVRRIRSPG